MNDKINISKGDIPETDEEVEKILAKKPATKRKLALVQTPVAPETPEKEAEKETSEQTPVQPELKHSIIVWHPSVNGLELYGYTSQQILDVADKVYALYGQTPTVHLYGECLCGDKVIRLRQEQAVYKDVTNDAWHLPLLGVDVEPIGGTFPKARVGVLRPDAFERWEETPERKTYRAKVLDSLRIG